MSKAKCIICDAVVLIVATSAGVGAFTLSYLAASQIGVNDWHAADYWCAWFSAVSFILGVASTIFTFPASFALYYDICDNSNRV